MRFFPSSSSVCIILQYSTLTTPQPPPSLPSFTTSARFDRGFFLPLLSSPRGGILVFFFVSMLLLLPSRESELISVSARPLALPLEFRRLCRVPSWVGLSLHLILLRLGCCCFSFFWFLFQENHSHSQPRGIHFASLTFSNLHFLFHCFLGFDVTCLGCVLSPVGPEYSLPLSLSESGITFSPSRYSGAGSVNP